MDDIEKERSKIVTDIDETISMLNSLMDKADENNLPVELFTSKELVV